MEMWLLSFLSLLVYLRTKPIRDFSRGNILCHNITIHIFMIIDFL